MTVYLWYIRCHTDSLANSVILRFMILKASRDLRGWADKTFLAESDMRKELLLSIHVQLALLDRDCSQPSFVGCLSIWVIWAGPNSHPLSNKSRVLLDEWLNWESQGSDLLKPQGQRRHGNKLPRAWPKHPRSATEYDLFDLSSQLSKLTTQFAHLCPESQSEIAWPNPSFRLHHLAWRYQKMERAYHKFWSNNHIALALKNVFTNPDTAWLVIDSIWSCAWSIPGNTEDDPRDNKLPLTIKPRGFTAIWSALEEMNAWNIQQA